MSDPSIIKITSKDKALFKKALSLLNQVLGENLYTEESLQKKSDGEDELLLVYFDDGEMAGVAMAGRLREDGINRYSPFGEAALELLRTGTIGVLRNSAVKPDSRGKGIGTSLLDERLEWLKQIGCDHAVGLTWLHGKTTQSDQLYRAAGFEQIGPVVSEFFKSMSEITGLHCPYCGFPCLCSASMFVKKLV
jgi:GNAT superfamily N-acetyltransferase